jgi:GNAT superfamily N-acetyltransferase
MGSGYVLTRIGPQDLQDVFDLGLQMRNEGAFRSLDYDRDCVFRFLRQYVDSPDINFGVVGRRNGVLCGFFTGYMSPYFFGRDLIATEVLWYVSPADRGSRLGLRLLRAFEAWALERGASEVCVGVSTGVFSDRTGRLLQRLGYAHVGGNYKLPVVR